MKKKFTVILLSAALGAAMLVGCGKSDRKPEREMSHGWEDEDAVYGEVSKAAEDLITIKIGTRKEMERTKEASSKKPEENQAGERPSMLDLTGEEQVIKVTEETVLKRQTMRGLPGNGDVQKKPDGEPPQEPGAGQENNSEEITVSDISEGDIVMVKFTDDKKAAEITVLSVWEGNEGEANSPAGAQDNGAGTV